MLSKENSIEYFSKKGHQNMFNLDKREKTYYSKNLHLHIFTYMAVLSEQSVKGKRHALSAFGLVDFT